RQFDVRLQLCLAHLIREVKYLTTLPDKRTRAYGERFREALRRLFEVVHKRPEMTGAAFRNRLEAAKAEVLRQATQDVPATKAAANLALRMQKYGECYFRFITTPGVEPTNNLAEQAIRFVVIDRHITPGTRGQTGQRWSERIWSVIATCVQQGRSVWEYLQAAVQAHFTGQPGPTLLPEEGEEKRASPGRAVDARASLTGKSPRQATGSPMKSEARGSAGLTQTNTEGCWQSQEDSSGPAPPRSSVHITVAGYRDPSQRIRRRLCDDTRR